MIVGDHEAAGARDRGDADRDAAHAGREDRREIALVRADQLGFTNGFAGEEFEARHGVGELGRRIGHGRDGDIFGPERPFGPVLPFHLGGAEALTDADRPLGHQDLGLLLFDDLGRGRWAGAGGRPVRVTRKAARPPATSATNSRIKRAGLMPHSGYNGHKGPNSTVQIMHSKGQSLVNRSFFVCVNNC